jgi:hypothetical protein
MPHVWDNFSIMSGTAAATLIGLLFVAITVTTGLPTSRIVQGTRGFLTPTLVRFAGVLFLSLVMLAPWPSAWSIGIILGLGGLTGLIYQTTVVLRHVSLTSLDTNDLRKVGTKAVERCPIGQDNLCKDLRRRVKYDLSQ